jgi:hydrogenase expression/formation protein HypE
MEAALRKPDRILLSHGDGGKRTRDLIEKIFLERFDNPTLSPLFDSGYLGILDGSVAFTTDSYVVTPPFFPGGDIGKLAVCGTLNDLSVSGATPRAISCAVIIEEGLPMEDLEKISDSIHQVVSAESVIVACGDTKVVERGKGDKIFINTSGIGTIDSGWLPRPEKIVEGDKVIITGTMGDHGVAVLVARENLKLSSNITSDVAPLSRILLPLIHKFGGEIRFMRDPTRGGVGVTVNEISSYMEGAVLLDEASFPLHPSVRGVSELLGFDPLYLANEGKALLYVSASAADEVLSCLRSTDLGGNAAIIGEIAGKKGPVLARTVIGGTRVVDYPVGEQLPRIC